MTDRTPITRLDILSGTYSSEKEYYFLNILEINVLLQPIFDINLLVEWDLIFQNCRFLKTIGENVFTKGKLVIYGCPLLKTLPNNLITDKEIYFSQNQFYTTIFSEEQFNLIKSLDFNKNHIYSYSDYYYLIKDTLSKEEISKICTL